MMMKPPTLPEDYQPVVYADELAKVLEAIHRATAPGSADGEHTQAHRLAGDALRSIEARAAYDAKFDARTRPAAGAAKRMTPVGAGDGNTFVVG